uniref:Uncharacterized protein n=1 Tax=Octopus bimaculoides TaxID=37653 RepID=A0A0L8I803_OCTBM
MAGNFLYDDDDDDDDDNDDDNDDNDDDNDDNDDDNDDGELKLTPQSVTLECSWCIVNFLRKEKTKNCTQETGTKNNLDKLLYSSMVLSTFSPNCENHQRQGNQSSEVGTENQQLE